MPWVYADTATLGVKHLLLPFFLIRLRGWARVAPDSMLTSAQRIHPGRVATSWQTKWDGARWFFKICVNTYVCISLSTFIHYICYTYISCVFHVSFLAKWMISVMIFNVHQCQGDNILVWSLIQMTQKQEEFDGRGYASMFAPRMGKISTPESLAIFFRLIRKFAAAGCSMP